MKMVDDLKPAHRFSDRAFDAAALVLIFLAYFIVFWTVRRDSDFAGVMVASLTNLTPLILLTAGMRPAIRRWLIGASLLWQTLGHIAFAAVFSFGWQWMLLILFGMRTGGSLTEFTVSVFFPEPALAWQYLQGVTVYALLASLTYLRAKPKLSALGDAESGGWPEHEPALKRYFIRLGENIQPIEVSRVISIVGADDYAEVTTLEGQHLVRTTLSKFEASLDPEQFLRVHRSRIVNINRIDRAESNGDGRINLHMENGACIQTSRAGAKALRTLVL